MFQWSEKYLKSILLLTVFTIPTAFAQVDSVEYHIGTLLGASTQGYLPHWMTANRFGLLDDDENAVGLLSAGAQSTYKVAQKLSVSFGIEAMVKRPFIEDQSVDVFLQEGYLKIKYDIFELSGGRMERTLGTHAEEISSGSLALSGNTRPVPQILIAVPEYSRVPFTKGFAEFKGTYAHGWLGEERYVKGANLHEKSLYLKIGGKFPINFSAGLIHHVIWGGKHPSAGKLPSGFKDYLQVITGRSGEGLDTTNNLLLGEASNALGDNLGLYDFGLHTHLKEIDILLYHQTPYEDWTGTRLFRNRDRLLGLNIKNARKDRIITGFVYEFLDTRYQSGLGLPGAPNDPSGDSGYGYDYGGRDNYYNNYLYRTGWVYQDRIIGTPLFFTKSRARLYIENFSDPDENRFDFNVVNNRVLAHHIGVQGELKYFKFRMLSTFSNNSGTYGGINGGISKWGSIENPDLEYAFKPPKNQNYYLLEIESHPFSENWTLSTTIAWETGALSRNMGVLIGLKRTGMVRLKNSVDK